MVLAYCSSRSTEPRLLFSSLHPLRSSLKTSRLPREYAVKSKRSVRNVVAVVRGGLGVNVSRRLPMLPSGVVVRVSFACKCLQRV
jgi:hypothetical protein